ncbi:MAG: glycosyltransferase family 39 protein [Blastocatellia bacterium]
MILACAFALRVGVFAAALWCAKDYTIFYAKDSATYLLPATALLTTGTFSTEQRTEIMRTPGYPLLLLPGIKLGHVELITILLQILLSCGTCYLVYATARHVFQEERSAIFAALLFSLEPLSILHSVLLLSDTLFVFFVVAALNRLLCAWQEGHWANWVGAALALAGAVYTRPVGYFLPLVLTLVLMVWASVKRERKTLFRAAAFGLLTMSLLIAWQVRNWLATGYAGFSTTSELVLYFYHSGAVKAQQQGLPFYEVVEQLGYYDSAVYFRQHPDQQTWTPGRRYAYLRSEGLRTLQQSPGISAQLYTRGILVMLLDPGVVEYLRLFQQYRKSDRVMNVMAKQGMLAAAQRVIGENPKLIFFGGLLGGGLLGFYLLSWIGLGRVSLRTNFPLLILLSVGFYFIAVSGGLIAVSRFRLPLMPLLSIFAGQGISRCWDWAKRKNLGRNRTDFALKTESQENANQP